MSAIAPPSPSKGPSPTLRTLHEVEAILRRARAQGEGPLSLSEIGRRMEAKSVRHATLRACVDELRRFHLVTEDPKAGVLWTLEEDPDLWRDDDVVRLGSGAGP